MTLYESPYEYLPTQFCKFFLFSSRLHAYLSLDGEPNIFAILARWRRLVTRDDTLLQHPAPFVAGYFSIHISMYPGIQQLRSGLSQPLTVTTPRRNALYHPYQQSRSSKKTIFLNYFMLTT